MHQQVVQAVHSNAATPQALAMSGWLKRDRCPLDRLTMPLAQAPLMTAAPALQSPSGSNSRPHPRHHARRVLPRGLLQVEAEDMMQSRQVARDDPGHGDSATGQPACGGAPNSHAFPKPCTATFSRLACVLNRRVIATGNIQFTAIGQMRGCATCGVINLTYLYPALILSGVGVTDTWEG